MNTPDDRVAQLRAELAEAEREAMERQGRDPAPATDVGGPGGPTPDVPPPAEAVSTATVDEGPRPADPERKSLASLTSPDRDEAELQPAERLYVDHAAGRLNDHDALSRLLALAAGCDDDVYADERDNA